MIPSSAKAVPVGLELALLADVSSSVSAAEFNLLKNGYASAFNSPSLQAAIQAIGGVAVTLVQWAHATAQKQTHCWNLVEKGPTASAFWTAVKKIPPGFY